MDSLHEADSSFVSHSDLAFFIIYSNQNTTFLIQELNLMKGARMKTAVFLPTYQGVEVAICLWRIEYPFVVEDV